MTRPSKSITNLNIEVNEEFIHDYYGKHAPEILSFIHEHLKKDFHRVFSILGPQVFCITHPDGHSARIRFHRNPSSGAVYEYRLVIDSPFFHLKLFRAGLRNLTLVERLSSQRAMRDWLSIVCNYFGNIKMLEEEVSNIELPWHIRQGRPKRSPGQATSSKHYSITIKDITGRPIPLEELAYLADRDEWIRREYWGTYQDSRHCIKKDFPRADKLRLFKQIKNKLEKQPINKFGKWTSAKNPLKLTLKRIEHICEIPFRVPSNRPA